jgi:transcriptional regulator with XRE-family HTH domain
MIKTLAQTGDKSVGESIRDLRTSRGLSIRELATETGLSSAAISRWESGKRIPSVESFNKVMAALNAELTVVAK